MGICVDFSGWELGKKASFHLPPTSASLQEVELSFRTHASQGSGTTFSLIQQKLPEHSGKELLLTCILHKRGKPAHRTRMPLSPEQRGSASFKTWAQGARVGLFPALHRVLAAVGTDAPGAICRRGGQGGSPPLPVLLLSTSQAALPAPLPLQGKLAPHTPATGPWGGHVCSALSGQQQAACSWA